MPHTTINSWHAALMAVECAYSGYGSSLLSLIVMRCAAWKAWMCLSHPWQLRSGHHQNHAMELTSELIMSDSVIEWTPNLNGGTADHRAATALAADSRVGEQCGRSSGHRLHGHTKQDSHPTNVVSLSGLYFPQKYLSQDVHSSPEQLSFRPEQIGLDERAQKTTLMKCMPPTLNNFHTSGRKYLLIVHISVKSGTWDQFQSILRSK